MKKSLTMLSLWERADSPLGLEKGLKDRNSGRMRWCLRVAFHQFIPDSGKNSVKIFYFVLPDPQNLPAFICQSSLFCVITFLVLFQFWVPIALMALRKMRVDRATVPETPVNKDRELLGRKSNINFLLPVVYSISQTMTPECFP